MGGTSMLTGFRHRLMNEIQDLMKQPKYAEKLMVKDVKLHNPPAKANCVAWLGGKLSFKYMSPVPRIQVVQ